jgi:hypothetical protein
MSGRRALTGGKPRVMGSHAGWAGKEYGRQYAALAGAYVLDTPMKRQEAGRLAMRWVRWQQAVRTLQAAEQARQVGRGRRPSAGVVRQLTKREWMENEAYGRALASMGSWAARRNALNGGGWPS